MMCGRLEGGQGMDARAGMMSHSRRSCSAVTYRLSRDRRKKCDETRPTCKACAERNEKCTYPQPTNVRPSQPQLLARKAANNQVNFEVARPTTALFENEQFLVQHFCGTLSQLLSFRLHGPTNPFSLHLLPLAQSSSVVLGAVETMSTAHMCMLGTKPPAEAGDMHMKSLRLLSSHISTTSLDGATGEIALTASLLMVYYEVILGDSAENALCHLKRSKAILDRLGNTTPSQSNGRIGFLSKIFHYFDVMVALSLRMAPLGPQYSLHQEDETVDEIFGLTAGMWPTMHLVAQAMSEQDSSGLDDDAPRKAQELFDQLCLTTTLDLSQQEISGNQSEVDLEAITQIAKAHRFSALLVLHHEVLRTQDPNMLNYTYRSALDALLRIAALDGPTATYSTSVWPLFTVSRYAQSPADRTILRHIFTRIYQRHHMKIVVTADQGMEQLWKTKMDDTVSAPPSVFFA